MNRSERRDTLRGSIDTLLQVANQLASLEREWDDRSPGVPGAKPIEQDRTTGHTTVLDEHGMPVPSVSDPTGEAAVTKSRARTDADRFDKAVGRAARAAKLLGEISGSWTTHQPMTRAELVQAERNADPGCDVVRQVKRDDGSGQWEPTFKVTTLGGLLDKPMRLGRWAYDFATRAGRLPIEHEVKAHLQGKRLFVRPDGSVHAA